MRRTSIALSLAWLAGCSFIDDFDQFKASSVEPNDDGGVAPDASTRDARTDAQQAQDARARDAVVPTQDAEVEPNDAGMVEPPPPPVCSGTVCDDGDPCTDNVCMDGAVCSYPIRDLDGDGYAAGVCKPGSTVRGGDCNDRDPAINPGAPELCDNIDNNCDGQIDEGFNNKLQCYPDRDRDRFADLEAEPVSACNSCPAGTIMVANASDTKLHDCWDDPDTGGEDVFPGQTNFKSEGYGDGPKAERSFDYDCNGKVETKFGALPGGCLGLLGLVCDSSAGFVDEVLPGCGETGMYQKCGQNGITCSGNTEFVTQECK